MDPVDPPACREVATVELVARCKITGEIDTFYFCAECAEAYRLRWGERVMSVTPLIEAVELEQVA